MHKTIILTITTLTITSVIAVAIPPGQRQQPSATATQVGAPQITNVPIQIPEPNHALYHPGNIGPHDQHDQIYQLDQPANPSVIPRPRQVSGKRQGVGAPVPGPGPGAHPGVGAPASGPDIGINPGAGVPRPNPYVAAPVPSSAGSVVREPKGPSPAQNSRRREGEDRF